MRQETLRDDSPPSPAAKASDPPQGRVKLFGCGRRTRWELGQKTSSALPSPLGRGQDEGPNHREVVLAQFFNKTHLSQFSGTDIL